MMEGAILEKALIGESVRMKSLGGWKGSIREMENEFHRPLVGMIIAVLVGVGERKAFRGQVEEVTKSERGHTSYRYEGPCFVLSKGVAAEFCWGNLKERLIRK